LSFVDLGKEWKAKKVRRVPDGWPEEERGRTYDEHLPSRDLLKDLERSTRLERRKENEVRAASRGQMRQREKLTMMS